MNNMPYGTLRDIASELKNIRKVLERMVQAPMFDIPESVYVCYKKDCDNCTRDNCKNRKRKEFHPDQIKEVIDKTKPFSPKVENLPDIVSTLLANAVDLLEVNF